MNGLARRWTGLNPARPWRSYSQSRPVSSLLPRPIEFTWRQARFWRQKRESSEQTGQPAAQRLWAWRVVIFGQQLRDGLGAQPAHLVDGPAAGRARRADVCDD